MSSSLNSSQDGSRDGVGQVSRRTIVPGTEPSRQRSNGKRSSGQRARQVSARHKVVDLFHSCQV